MTTALAGRTETLLKEVRTTALFRAVVPMEAQIGWPVLRRRDGEVYALLPLFGARRDGRRTLLFPPLAVLTVNHRTGRVAEYQDLRYTRPWPVTSPPAVVGEFPHAAVAGTIGDYLTDRTRLLDGYDGLVDAMRAGHAFAGEAEFADLLGRLVEPGLLPYFRAVGPEFYERFLGPGPAAG